jgi:hypothetical protein
MLSRASRGKSGPQSGQPTVATLVVADNNEELLGCSGGVHSMLLRLLGEVCGFAVAYRQTMDELS